MRVIIGSDHAGYKLKEHIASYLSKKKHEVVNFGCYEEKPVDYPDIAEIVCKSFIHEKQVEKIAILVCGTGIGISICANKYSKDIICALCNDTYMTKLAREHNDANVLALGGRIVAPVLAEDIVDTFINTNFINNQRHSARILKMKNSMMNNV